MRACHIAVCVWMAFGTVTIARADTGAAAAQGTALERAQSLFTEAAEQLKLGNAAVSRDLFRRSLALHSRIPTRHNLAVALRRTGETLEAVDMFEGLLAEPSLTSTQRDKIAAELEGARSELATLTVQVTGAAEATIELDGRQVGEVQEGKSLELVINAGEHVVLARAGTTTRSQVRIAPGKSLTTTLHVMSIAERDRAVRKKTRRRRAGWITGGIAVAAAVITGAVLAARKVRQTADPLEGDLPTFTP